jgi:hypothetical protein
VVLPGGAGSRHMQRIKILKERERERERIDFRTAA